MARIRQGAGKGDNAKSPSKPKSRSKQKATATSHKLVAVAVAAFLILAAWWVLGSTHGGGGKPAHTTGKSPAKPKEKGKERSTEDRIRGATALLESLKAVGLVQHVALDTRMTEHAGLGVFVAEPVKAGAPIFELPSSLMLKGATKKEEGSMATGLVVALAKERRRPSTKHMELHLESMPVDCPDNLATRPGADSRLVSASLHKWKADLVRDETAIFKKELPGASVRERKWAMCMVLSRALLQAGHGTVRTHTHTRTRSRGSKHIGLAPTAHMLARAHTYHTCARART